MAPDNESDYNAPGDDIGDSVSYNLLQLVGFTLGTEEFAIDILSIQEIIRMIEITPVPKTPSFIKGIINLRGKISPVIDLKNKFNIDQTERTKESRIIVIHIAGNSIGLIVDSVSEVLRIPIDTIEPPPPVTDNIKAEYIKGVGKLDARLLILLNLDKVLAVEEIALLEEVTA